MGGLQLSENPRKSRKRSGDFNSSASGTKKHNTKKNSRNQSSDRNRKNNKQKTRGIGPRLPLGFKKELAEFIETRRKDEPHSDDDSEDSPDKDVPASDFIYEYHEPLPQEETKKNKRFDPVDNFEYELPEDFKDEEIDEDLADAGDSDKEEEEEEQVQEEEEEEEEDDDPTRHLSMLQRITGLPAEAFERKSRKKGPAEGSETINNTSDVNQFTKVTSMSMKELVDTLQGQPGYSRVRKMMEPFTKKQKLGQVGLQTAPLPKAIQAKLERTAAYKLIRDDVTKWEPLVKKNREASTLFFDDDNHVKVSTIDEMASGFKPRLDLEKKINSILEDAKIVEAYADDGAKILELNEVSVESVQDTLNKRAKMRSLLFHHEVKAKHIKKIKSKTYHRLQKKSRSKFALDDDEMDPEAAKEYAMKQEFKRAEERMTLKHKNSSKWAKRILKRGLQSQDAGTRAAITEQLQQHALLKRKMNTVKGSSSDESSDEDEGIEESGSDDDVPSKLVGKAKERTLGILNEEEEMPKSGLLSLPFMVRGMEKRKQVAYQEAELALKEYESLENSGDNGRAAGRQKSGTSGKMVFGEIKSQRHETSQFEHDGGQNSDSEGDEHEMNPKYNEAKELGKAAVTPKEHLADPTLLLEDLGIRYDPVFQDYVGLEKESDPRIVFDVSICAPVSRTERKNERRAGNKEELNREQEFDDEKIIGLHDLPGQDMKVEERGAESSNDSANGSESESESMLEYKMPSIEDVRKAAFAGDDVEEEFEKTKLEVLNEENPEPEAPVLVPGWGQWTDVQKKKGLPSWMVAEYETAKKKREDALTLRKDAHLKDIIISEKVNKKAEKYYTKALPFPYKSKEAFEQTMRVPLGPDFNPSRAFRELNRPQVVKKAGVIINPIEFKELDSQDCPELKANDKKPKPKKNAGRKPTPKKFIQLANKK